MSEQHADIREAVTAIAQDPERHMARKLAIMLDGIAARVAPQNGGFA